MNRNPQKFDPRQTMSDKNYEVFYYKDPKPADVEVHHHDFYEVYCLMGGDVTYWVDGRTYHLRPGDILLISPLELHKPMVKQGAPYERLVLWIKRSYLDNLFQGTLNKCFHEISNHFHGGSINTLLSALYSESYSNKFGSDIASAGIFLQLMVELNRLSPVGSYYSASSQLIGDILEYINVHYSESLSLDTISQEFHMSKYHLSHKFKDETGTSLYHYITLKRLAAARQLLINGTPPGEACIACGFRDYTVFYKAFKNEYGTSPVLVNQIMEE